MQLSIYNGGGYKENRRQTAQPACNPNLTQTTKTSHPANPQEVVVLSKLPLLQTKKHKPKPHKNRKNQTTKKNKKQQKRTESYQFAFSIGTNPKTPKPQTKKHAYSNVYFAGKEMFISAEYASK